MHAAHTYATSILGVPGNQTSALRDSGTADQEAKLLDQYGFDSHPRAREATVPNARCRHHGQVWNRFAYSVDLTRPILPSGASLLRPEA